MDLDADVAVAVAVDVDVNVSVNGKTTGFLLRRSLQRDSRRKSGAI